MISDVLSDALRDIEDYQRYMPEAYSEITAEIEVVKAVMDGLRIVLDAAPGQTVEHESLIAELRSAIRGLDVSGIVLGRVVDWVIDEREKEFQRNGDDSRNDSTDVCTD